MEPAWTCTFSIINTTLGRQREEDSRREEKQRKMWEMQGHRTDGENKSSGRKLRIWAEGWVRRWTGTEREEKKRQGRQERSNWGQKQTDFSQYIHKGGGKLELNESDRWEGRKCVKKRNATWHVMLLGCMQCILPHEERQNARRGRRERGGGGGVETQMCHKWSCDYLQPGQTHTYRQTWFFFFLQAKFRKVRCSSAKYITSKKLWTEGRKKRL